MIAAGTVDDGFDLDTFEMIGRVLDHPESFGLGRSLERGRGEFEVHVSAC